MLVTKVETHSEIQDCYETLTHLYSLDRETFIDRVELQYQQGYRIACVRIDKKVASLIGYRMLDSFSPEKILWIHDFITHPAYRNKGYGTLLLDWIKETAQNNNCLEIHLTVDYAQYDALRFCLNNGFKLSGHHVIKI